MSETLSSSKKPLTLFNMVMMTVIAIDSLKNLPAIAQYGNSLLFYYLIVIVTFFIPSALVAAELSTGWPQTGGIYIWVREAFGKGAAFTTVWIQWIFALIWYPTILSFIAVTLAYLISPQLAENKFYILATILTFFWGATYLSCIGLKLSSVVSTVCAVLGVIVPMLFIIFLGAYWLCLKQPSQVHFSVKSLSVNLVNTDNLRLFINLMYSLMGMEMIAVHAGDTRNPIKDFPRTLVIATIIILATVIPSALAIAMVISPKDISLTTGVIEAFTVFLNSFHLVWVKPLIIISVAVGSFGIFLTWLLASSRGLFVAASDGCLPVFLQKTNKKNMPTTVLLTQGIIFTLLCGAFVLMPSVNSAFWLLTAAASQLALIYYLFLFSSALYLRYKKPDINRPFKVGKHPAILWTICLIAMATCLISVGFGFLPPPDINQNNLMSYELFLIVLMVGAIGSAVGIYSFCKRTG